jgi:hypothetical protein
MPVKRQLQADGSLLLSKSGCSSRFALLKPGVALVTTSGVGDDEIDFMMLDEIERALVRDGKLKLFCDMTGLKRMSPNIRDRAVAWGKKNSDKLTVHLLIGSKLVEMALSVLAMLVGGGLTKTYSDRGTFIALLRNEVPGFGDLPRLAEPSADARTASR